MCVIKFLSLSVTLLFWRLLVRACPRGSSLRAEFALRNFGVPLGNCRGIFVPGTMPMDHPAFRPWNEEVSHFSRAVARPGPRSRSLPPRRMKTLGRNSSGDTFHIFLTLTHFCPLSYLSAGHSGQRTATPVTRECQYQICCPFHFSPAVQLQFRPFERPPRCYRSASEHTGHWIIRIEWKLKEEKREEKFRG